MTPIVLDASVLAKLFFDEDQTDRARRIVAKAEELVAPDLILAEVANVVWKRCLRREINAESAAEIVDLLLRFPIRLVPAAEILGDAVDIALAHERSVYDSLYIATAIRHQTTLITADRRLARAMAGTAFAEFVSWIGD